MPRVVRNWWVESECDGRTSAASFGPKSKGGGFRITIYQRDAGSVLRAVDIIGEANGEDLTLSITDRDGDLVNLLITKR